MISLAFWEGVIYDPYVRSKGPGSIQGTSVAISGHFKVIIHTVAVCIMFISARMIEMIEAKMQSYAFARIKEVAWVCMEV